jgi:class 3 adenylate cyclase/tetratricopeptide (TPR) repeat protein
MVARERKVITVLFADLVGFTATSEQLDPEDVADILRPYHERLRYELERWGGTVEKFIGDAVMALFGAPVTREDDPERAVRAALAIRDWIVEEGKLEVRIAVNTGEALVDLDARPESGEGMAAGDVVNTAARLQSAAPVNGILAGETTYRATAERIDYHEHESVEAKGKDAPVPVWEVVQARARFGVDLAPEARTLLIGREREVNTLVDTLDRARQQRSTELITLVGVPGIGKSRLVGELFQSIERGGQLTFWRQGRSLPYGQGVSYWALAEMVKAQAGILETDTDDEAEAKLVRAVEPLIEEDADWVLSHLRPLVGQGATAGSQEEAFAAWRRFWEALAEEHALVLVFEDIQWADDGLLDFIEHLVDWVRDVPLLILCTARLEFLERRPSWGGGKVNASTIALAPLTDEETAKLLWALGSEAESTLVERAGGNPLYAEQYVRMRAERGMAEDVPETVQGIIAARLDSLPADEKVLLQNAAVVGKVFWLGALGATEQQLRALQQKEFVQRARRSSVERETEYAFKHLLVRDVAYGQVPRAERAQKHLSTAGWIESLGRPDDHAEMLAHHYGNALELLRASRQDVDAVAPRARRAFRDAGVRAATLNALPAAERYFADALALTPEDGPERADLLFRRGEVEWYRFEEGAEDLEAARDAFLAAGHSVRAAEPSLLLAQIAWRSGRREQVEEHMDAARSMVAGQPPSRIQAAVLAEASRYAMLADRADDAVRIGREALRLAEELGLDDLRAGALNNIGMARAKSGDRGGADEVQQSIELARKINSASDLLRGLNNLAVHYLIYGELASAGAVLDELVEIAQRFGHLGFLRFVEGGPLIGRSMDSGDWDEALRRADEFLRVVEAGSPHYQAPGAYVARARIRVARDDEKGAAADAQRAIELARPGGDPQQVMTTLPEAAFVFTQLGDERRGREVFEACLREHQRMAFMGLSVIAAPPLAWEARLFGREDELEPILARERLQTPWLEAAREVLAGDMSGAGALLDTMGSPTEAAFYRLQSGVEQDVRAALEFYRGVSATRYVRQGESLLAATA